jgi:hypothetical protein
MTEKNEIMGSTSDAYATLGNKTYFNDSLLATDNKDLLGKALLAETGHSFDPILNYAPLNAPPIPTDNAKNTLATARNLGNLAGIRSFADWVGFQDTNDYYRFTLNSSSNFSIFLDGMTANADLQLLNSFSSVIESSTTGGLTAEAIFGDLNVGTYYVRVYPVGSANTNYNLNFVAFPGGFGN